MKKTLFILAVMCLFISYSACASSSGSSKNVIWDGTNKATVNSEGNFNVIQHSHVDEGQIHLHKEFTTSEKLILIDLSDIVNYPHKNTNYIHIDYMRIETDATATANYLILFGFLDTVTATSGNRYSYTHTIASRTLNQNKEIILPYAPNGPKCKVGYITTSEVSTADTSYQTDVNLASTLNPLVQNTPSGSGDVIMEVTVNAGTVDIAVDIGYHSH